MARCVTAGSSAFAGGNTLVWLGYAVAWCGGGTGALVRSPPGCRGAGDSRWAHNVLAGGATGCLAWMLAFVAWLIVSVVATG